MNHRGIPGALACWAAGDGATLRGVRRTEITFQVCGMTKIRTKDPIVPRITPIVPIRWTSQTDAARFVIATEMLSQPKSLVFLVAASTVEGFHMKVHIITQTHMSTIRVWVGTAAGPAHIRIRGLPQMIRIMHPTPAALML